MVLETLGDLFLLRISAQVPIVRQKSHLKRALDPGCGLRSPPLYVCQVKLAIYRHMNHLVYTKFRPPRCMSVFDNTNQPIPESGATS